MKIEILECIRRYLAWRFGLVGILAGVVILVYVELPLIPAEVAGIQATVTVDLSRALVGPIATMERNIQRQEAAAALQGHAAGLKPVAK
jgi:hypothetical protein